jgi:putative drug exporter of the RND superfamily
MFRRLSATATRAPRRTIAAWVVVLVVGLGAAGSLFASLDGDLDGSDRFESARVDQRLAELDPGGGEIVAVVEAPTVGAAVLEDLRAIDGVEAAGSIPSDDGRATAVGVSIRGGLTEDAHGRAVDAVVDRLRSIEAGPVAVGGEELLDDEVAELAERDAQRAEALSLPIALVLMAVVFGGVLAAGLPLAIALSGVALATLGLAALSAVTDVSLYALNVTIMLGLGLGIDYGLLVVSRFREERGAGLDVAAAVARTMATAGRTIVFSALTVAVALASLLVFDDPTIRSLSLAGIGVVLAALLSAHTLLPVLLRRVGHRLRPSTPAAGHGAFAHLARVIQRRAWPVVLGVGALLVLLGLPFLGARFDDTGVKALPRSSETRQVAEAIDARFPSVTAEPLDVIAGVGRGDPSLPGWLADVEAIPGVKGAEVRDDVGGVATTLVEVQPEGPTNGPGAQAVVRSVRALDPGFEVLVGGDPAEIVDFRGALTARLPLAVALLVVATFVLLFLMTGSVVVPVKAIVMNVLSLGATFGALVWVFQEGHLSGVLGFDPPGSLDLVMPVVVFVFAFGLSMDYEVFLLSRIQEVWEATGDNDRAVAEGLQRSGRIITSAALLVVVVFAGFAAGDVVAMKQLGLGLAIAVVVDATIVRSLLVPAAMELMGRWNWWAPPALRRFHARHGLRDAPPVPSSEDEQLTLA